MDRPIPYWGIFVITLVLTRFLPTLVPRENIPCPICSEVYDLASKPPWHIRVGLTLELPPYLLSFSGKCNVCKRRIKNTRTYDESLTFRNHIETVYLNIMQLIGVLCIAFLLWKCMGTAFVFRTVSLSHKLRLTKDVGCIYQSNKQTGRQSGWEQITETPGAYI
jgi:hypothetical protein